MPRKSEAAKERNRIAQRARYAAKRAAREAERLSRPAPEYAPSDDNSGQIRFQEAARSGKADGRLLGLYSFNSLTGGDARWTPNRALHGARTPELREQERRDLEARLEQNELAGVVLEGASRSYDPCSKEDIARTAMWVIDLRPDLDDRDVRATLSTIPGGARITFPPPEDEPREPDEPTSDTGPQETS